MKNCENRNNIKNTGIKEAKSGLGSRTTLPVDFWKLRIRRRN